MDLETIIQSEGSQICMQIPCIYVESRKMVQMNLSAKQKWRHSWRGQMYGHQERKGGGVWDELED